MERNKSYIQRLWCLDNKRSDKPTAGDNEQGKWMVL